MGQAKKRLSFRLPEAVSYVTMSTGRRLLIVAQILLTFAYAFPVLGIPDRLTGSDFRIYYTGAAIVRDGKGSRLYDLDLQRRYEAEVVAQGDSNARYTLFPFINPPHAALLLVPFTWFSPKTGNTLYLIFNCIIAVWILSRLLQMTRRWFRVEQVLLLTTILAAEVFWYNLGLGTMTFFVFACVLEYYLALSVGKDIKAAVWLLAATVKPQIILFPALIPLVRRRGRLIGAAATLGLLVWLTVSLSLGFQVWSNYLRLLREVSTQGEKYGAEVVLMNNLRMILYWTVPTETIIPITYLALLFGGIGIFWLWRSEFEFGLRFSLTVLLGLFLAPYLHYQDTLVAFLPAALTFDFVRTQRTKLLTTLYVLVLASTFLPAVLILTGNNRPLGWIWPTPLIISLMAVCSIALHQERPHYQGL